MKTVFSGRIPDRVPFFPTIFTDHACRACGRRFEDALINPACGAEYMLEAALRYKTDAVRFLMGPEVSWYNEKLVVEEDGKLIQRDRATGKTEGFYDVAGGGVFLPLESPPLVRTIQEADSLDVMKAGEYLDRGHLRDVKRCVKNAHGKELFVVGLCSSQTVNFMVEHLGGTEAALLSFYDAPDLALALINKAVAISIERGKAFISIGVDCLYIGDSYASASVISPAIYERFCAPAYREVAQEFHRLGVLCYKHCCGNYNPLLDSLSSVGVDAMDGIDPTSGMNVKYTKEKVGSKLTLMGGLSCMTLLNGTTEQVFAEAAKCVEDGKPGGRYVLGSACAVPRFTPVENMLAAGRAALERGAY
jgi:uroporphyrinogen decarboxylase